MIYNRLCKYMLYDEYDDTELIQTICLNFVYFCVLSFFHTIVLNLLQQIKVQTIQLSCFHLKRLHRNTFRGDPKQSLFTFTFRLVFPGKSTLLCNLHKPGSRGDTMDNNRHRSDTYNNRELVGNLFHNWK